ncbi:MAG: rhomboid family intramembrane serine protease [Pseudomonadota bacterium]
MSRTTKLVLNRLQATNPELNCATIHISIRDAKNTKDQLQKLTDLDNGNKLFKNPSDQRRYIYQRLKASYEDFESIVPVNLTQEYAYHPLELQAKQMFTSILSHGGWGHLIFNLLFFFAFAASVEIIVGSIAFPFLVVLMAISTNLTYTFLADENTLPTIGLSGIVMGMMAFLAATLPLMRIRCFLWILVFFKIIRIPAWILAIGFIGMDIYNVQTDFTSNTNYIAHISGAVTGLIFGVSLWIIKPDYIRGLVAD